MVNTKVLLGKMLLPLFQMLPAMPFWTEIADNAVDFMNNIKDYYSDCSLNQRINLRALIVDYFRYPPRSCVMRRQAPKNAFWEDLVKLVAYLYTEKVLSLSKAINCVLSKLYEDEAEIAA